MKKNYPEWAKTKAEKMCLDFSSVSIYVETVSSRLITVSFLVDDLELGEKEEYGVLSTFNRGWAFRMDGSEFALCFDNIEQAFFWIKTLEKRSSRRF